MRSLVLSASPRRDGNSALLARAAAEGLREAGHDCELVFADDVLKSFLRDCQKCRTEDGECAIEDDFRRVFLDLFLPADGVVVATPVYWYGMSAQLKAFFDRAFCYIAASYPRSQDVVRRMTGSGWGFFSARRKPSRLSQPASSTKFRNTAATSARHSLASSMVSAMRAAT